jgi:lipopolysaccharide export system protein LptA
LSISSRQSISRQLSTLACARAIRRIAAAVAFYGAALILMQGVACAQETFVTRTYRVTARQVDLDLAQQRAHAEGEAVLSSDDIEVRADRIDVDLDAEMAAAAGNVRVSQNQNVLYAASVDYNLKQHTGTLLAAHGQTEGIYFTAESVRATPKELVLSNGTFTTCDRVPPDYHISAREIIVRPGERLISRKTAIWYKRRRLLRLPTWDISLRRGGPAQPFAPVAGFSRRDGAFAGPHLTLLAPGASLEMEALYTTRRGIRAFVEGALRPAWGTASVTGSYRQDLTEADLGLFAPPSPTTDITLDRLPEVAVESKPTPLGHWGQAALRVAAGRYHESPTGARASRAVTDVYLEGVPIALGGRASLQPLIGFRNAWYDTHQHRSAVAYGARADAQPTSNVALRLGYIERTASGSGPFAFDAVQIARELDLGLAARLAPDWRTEILARHDLDTDETPVLDVAIIYVAHCLEYGITWKRVGGEFGIRVGLAQTGPVQAPAW